MAKQITKNQHYVPQHYFKYFSGGGRNIAAHVLKTKKIINNCSISDQASKKFFYGDQSFEDQICTVESTIKLGLDDVQRREVVDTHSKKSIIEYITYQSSRTSKRRKQEQGAYRTIEAALNFGRNIKNIDQAKIWLSKNRVDNFQPNEQYWQWKCMQLAIDSNWQMSDLACILLKVTGTKNFIFSDAPTIFINPHMRNFSQFGTIGTFSKGLISIFPINNNLCAILYDKDVYRIAHTYRKDFYAHKKIIHIADQDVEILNKFQYLFAENCVYSKTTTDFILKFEDLRDQSKNQDYNCAIDVVVDNEEELTVKFHGILDDIKNLPELPFFEYELSRRYIKTRPKPLAKYKLRDKSRMERTKKLITSQKYSKMTFDEISTCLSLNGKLPD